MANTSSIWNELQQAERDHLGLHIHKLVKQGVLAQNILVITCQTQRRSEILRSIKLPLLYTPEINGEPGSEEFTFRLNALSEGIIPGSSPVATIRTAKGLESDAVILVELAGLREGQFASMSVELLRKYIHIGVSRARSRIVIFGNEKDIIRR